MLWASSKRLPLALAPRRAVRPERSSYGAGGGGVRRAAVRWPASPWGRLLPADGCCWAMPPAALRCGRPAFGVPPVTPAPTAHHRHLPSPIDPEPGAQPARRPAAPAQVLRGNLNARLWIRARAGDQRHEQCRGGEGARRPARRTGVQHRRTLEGTPHMFWPASGRRGRHRTPSWLTCFLVD